MNALCNPALNVVVAGAGGIGAAVAALLLDQYPIARMFVLRRGESAPHPDPRVTTLPVNALDAESIRAAGEAIAADCDRLHLVFNAVGMLHDSSHRPEKRLRDLNAGALQTLCAVNAFFLPQLAQAVSPLLRHSEPALLASLSARVGSIADNRLGGWYSYRASKAAHNMLLRTLALEWRLTHKQCAVVALHPGTVKTALSAPHTPANYQQRVLTPAESAHALLRVLQSLGPEQTGSFVSWEGETIPW